jgi:hypothetical protein
MTKFVLEDTMGITECNQCGGTKFVNREASTVWSENTLDLATQQYTPNETERETIDAGSWDGIYCANPECEHQVTYNYDASYDDEDQGYIDREVDDLHDLFYNHERLARPI